MIRQRYDESRFWDDDPQTFAFLRDESNAVADPPEFKFVGRSTAPAPTLEDIAPISCEYSRY